ncbi:MAG: pyrroline-5-carboxylate reductase [Blautia sp.]|nr:pyrroline-5-carboxylate reductase [Blautia sp.]
MSVKLGFIGNGNMGYAILKGLLQSQTLKACETGVFDPLESVRDRAAGLGSLIYDSEEALSHDSEIILVAVKPQYVKPVWEKLGKTAAGKLVISIVAGYSTAAIKEELGREDIRVLRVMPNTPAMVGAGVFGLNADTDALPVEKELAEKWFKALGLTQWIPEHLFSLITGLSGGGPAYVAMFVEALADAGVKHGLTRASAIQIAAWTVYGSAKLLLDEGMHPAILKDNVCSPAGTTIEGVQSLEEDGFRAAVIHAVDKSKNKADRL